MAPSRTSRIRWAGVSRALAALAVAIVVACAHSTAGPGEPASAAPRLAASGADPSTSAAPADEALVADAMDRRAAWLKAGCPEQSRSDGLPEAAATLREAAGGAPPSRARAVNAAARALTVAAAETYLCAAPEPARSGRHVLRANDFSIGDLSPAAELTAGSGHLRAWGEPEAAAAWARLASLAIQPREVPSYPSICRCMAQPTRGTPIAYGYPSDTMSLASAMGEVVLGGCVVSETSPRFLCAPGCRPDRLGLSESLPPSERRDLDVHEGGRVLLALAGAPPAVDTGRRTRLGSADYTALATCVGVDAEARAVRRDGAWTPQRDRAPDRCLADWLRPRFPDPGLDNAGARTRSP